MNRRSVNDRHSVVPAQQLLPSGGGYGSNPTIARTSGGAAVDGVTIAYDGNARITLNPDGASAGETFVFDGTEYTLQAVITSSGIATPGFLPLWTGANTLGTSVMQCDGFTLSAGIDPDPTAMLALTNASATGSALALLHDGSGGQSLYVPITTAGVTAIVIAQGALANQPGIDIANAGSGTAIDVVGTSASTGSLLSLAGTSTTNAATAIIVDHAGPAITADIARTSLTATDPVVRIANAVTNNNPALSLNASSSSTATCEVSGAAGGAIDAVATGTVVSAEAIANARAALLTRNVSSGAVALVRAEVLHASDTGNAIDAVTAGSGDALAASSFGSGEALSATAFGTGDAIEADAASGSAFVGTTSGTSATMSLIAGGNGIVGRFTRNVADATADVVSVHADNATDDGIGVAVVHDGTNSAAALLNTNAANMAPSLIVHNEGDGGGGYFSTSGPTATVIAVAGSGGVAIDAQGKTITSTLRATAGSPVAGQVLVFTDTDGNMMPGNIEVPDTSCLVSIHTGNAGTDGNLALPGGDTPVPLGFDNEVICNDQIDTATNPWRMTPTKNLDDTYATGASLFTVWIEGALPAGTWLTANVSLYLYRNGVAVRRIDRRRFAAGETRFFLSGPVIRDWDSSATADYFDIYISQDNAAPQPIITQWTGGIETAYQHTPECNCT